MNQVLLQLVILGLNWFFAPSYASMAGAFCENFFFENEIPYLRNLLPKPTAVQLLELPQSFPPNANVSTTLTQYQDNPTTENLFNYAQALSAQLKTLSIRNAVLVSPASAGRAPQVVIVIRPDPKVGNDNNLTPWPVQLANYLHQYNKKLLVLPSMVRGNSPAKSSAVGVVLSPEGILSTLPPTYIGHEVGHVLLAVKGWRKEIRLLPQPTFVVTSDGLPPKQVETLNKIYDKASDDTSVIAHMLESLQKIMTHPSNGFAIEESWTHFIEAQDNFDRVKSLQQAAKLPRFKDVLPTRQYAQQALYFCLLGQLYARNQLIMLKDISAILGPQNYFLLNRHPTLSSIHGDRILILPSGLSVMVNSAQINRGKTRDFDWSLVLDVQQKTIEQGIIETIEDLIRLRNLGDEIVEFITTQAVNFSW